ncbi:hypothetical protein SAMN05216503_2189 [Polaribacter sp. KT25b]|uniref:hypothetical protein n=1 Tax=Polaribacter sp. KT25b TaxID=1855336 RepID=UPI0008797948|nr:hypothetical protein [Polaribacter sp. KT25b]SDS16565.1 hypothetical protein SAMN05216503_2189 [Polaribacter sp. KT25b]
MKKVILLLLLYPINSFCQTSEKDALVWFDSIIGKKNLDINIGIRYIEKFRTLKDNSQFLIDDKFYASTINYNGQTYYNIPLKYDIYKDDLIFKIKSYHENYSTILDKTKIKSFITDGKLFINIADNGFNEKLFSENNFVIYKKNSKRVIKSIKSDFYYDEFILNNSYSLLVDDKFVPANEKSDWKKVFPSKKSEINKFFKKNRKKLKTSPDIFMKELLTVLTSNSLT